MSDIDNQFSISGIQFSILVLPRHNFERFLKPYDTTYNLWPFVIFHDSLFGGGLSFRGLTFRGLTFRGLSFRGLRSEV